MGNYYTKDTIMLIIRPISCLLIGLQPNRLLLEPLVPVTSTAAAGLGLTPLAGQLILIPSALTSLAKSP